MFTYTWFSTERNEQIKKVFCAIWNIWHLIHVQHMLAVLLANFEFTILPNTISLDHLPTVVFVVVISSFWTSVDKPTCLTIKVLLVLVSDCICQTQVKQIKYWGGNAVYTSPEELTNDDVSMIREEELICYSWSYVSFYVSICLYMSINSYDRRGRTNMLQLVLYVWLQQQPSAKFLLAGSELSQNHHPYHPNSPHWVHFRLNSIFQTVSAALFCQLGTLNPLGIVSTNNNYCLPTVQPSFKYENQNGCLRFSNQFNFVRHWS